MPSRSTIAGKSAQRFVGRGEAAAVDEVAAHRQMREEPPLLEDVADPAAMGRDEDAAPGVDQRVAVDGDARRGRAGRGRRSG